MFRRLRAGIFLLIITGCSGRLLGQPLDPPKQFRKELQALQQRVAVLRGREKIDRRLLADVDVCAKAVEWSLRHDEFYPSTGKDKPSPWIGYARRTLELGRQRAEELAQGRPSWMLKPGTTIRGYYSRVDGSVQPYAISLPRGINPRSGTRWPLHLKLHGRGATLNELRFINQHEGKGLPKDQDWIQLDVFGRTNNAYRYAGETDVFEALEDVQRRFRIDGKRITLWGFSMGGAGAWHLGLHHPSRWSSVGPGAGFVDFYKYQAQTVRRPPHQHATLSIYDAVPYALNAFNVPVCTYGGEVDKQLVASTSMVEQAQRLGVPIKLLIGPATGHRFHPEKFQEFMAFHRQHSKQGRRVFPGRTEIRFTTWTLKYNQCEWLTIEEMDKMYQPAVVQARKDDAGTLRLKTRNVAVLQIARDVADQVEIDGNRHPLARAADALLPGVFYERTADGWDLLDYNESRAFQGNPDGNKRHGLQGPIDDAFMESFVCVRGTGRPWSQDNVDWSTWTLQRFGREFDKWLRGRIRVVDDTAVTDELIANNNLVLFGDPGSNAVLARVLDKLPVGWTREAITVGGKTYDPQTHGLSLIFPNPLNPRRYVVLNSGHTFHEKDFRASNSWLFPRLGDIAVQKFQREKDGSYTGSISWAALFNSGWRLPTRKSGSKNAGESGPR